MAEFVKGNQINAELEKIFDQAQEQLVIISPFIKLHARVIDSLKSKKKEHRLKIIVVFGKNENNLYKSLSKEAFDFFKDFPNIEIKYEVRLHAKYYANESAALLSSMNLYDFSQDNNIEFGILTKATLLGALTGKLIGDTIDQQAFDYFNQVIDNATTLYSRQPFYKDSIPGLSIMKKYSHSDIVIDELSAKLDGRVSNSNGSKLKQSFQNGSMGFCIRSGEKIPFNPERPFSDKAYISWNKYKDKDYKEKFCHYSGEPSNGETSFAKPILKKNWRKANT